MLCDAPVDGCFFRQSTSSVPFLSQREMSMPSPLDPVDIVCALWMPSAANRLLSGGAAEPLGQSPQGSGTWHPRRIIFNDTVGCIRILKVADAAIRDIFFPDDILDIGRFLVPEDAPVRLERAVGEFDTRPCHGHIGVALKVAIMASAAKELHSSTLSAANSQPSSGTVAPALLPPAAMTSLVNPTSPGNDLSFRVMKLVFPSIKLASLVHDRIVSRLASELTERLFGRTVESPPETETPAAACDPLALASHAVLKRRPTAYDFIDGFLSIHQHQTSAATASAPKSHAVPRNPSEVACVDVTLADDDDAQHPNGGKVSLWVMRDNDAKRGEVFLFRRSRSALTDQTMRRLPLRTAISLFRATPLFLPLMRVVVDKPWQSDLKLVDLEALDNRALHFMCGSDEGRARLQAWLVSRGALMARFTEEDEDEKDDAAGLEGTGEIQGGGAMAQTTAKSPNQSKPKKRRTGRLTNLMLNSFSSKVDGILAGGGLASRSRRNRSGTRSAAASIPNAFGDAGLSAGRQRRAQKEDEGDDGGHDSDDEFDDDDDGDIHTTADVRAPLRFVLRPEIDVARPTVAARAAGYAPPPPANQAARIFKTQADPSSPRTAAPSPRHAALVVDFAARLKASLLHDAAAATSTVSQQTASTSANPPTGIATRKLLLDCDEDVLMQDVHDGRDSLARSIRRPLSTAAREFSFGPVPNVFDGRNQAAPRWLDDDSGRTSILAGRDEVDAHLAKFRFRLDGESGPDREKGNDEAGDGWKEKVKDDSAATSCRSMMSISTTASFNKTATSTAIPSLDSSYRPSCDRKSLAARLGVDTTSSTASVCCLCGLGKATQGPCLATGRRHVLYN